MDLVGVMNKSVELAGRTEVVEVAKTSGTVLRAVASGGKTRFIAEPRPAPRREHTMGSLESLLAFVGHESAIPGGATSEFVSLEEVDEAGAVEALNEAEADDAAEFLAPDAVEADRVGSADVIVLNETVAGPGQVAVFVGPNGVKANAAYGRHESVRGVFPLLHTESYAALLRLAAAKNSGVSQKVLWRTLIALLRDYVSPKLLMQVSRMDVALRDEGAVKIDASGLTQSSAGGSVSVLFGGAGGGASAPLDLDWEYNGPIWVGVDVAVKLRFRLEIDTEDGKVVFRTHLLGLQEVELQALEELVGLVRDGVPPSVLVYAGVE